MQSAENGTILIIDDTPTNLQVLLTCLQTAGYKVLIATDGEQALQHAQLGNPNLILLDIVMPGMDGFETCRRLKKLNGIQDVPVIFMTALGDTVNKLNGFAAGGVDYIVKPLEHEEVLARVRTHLTLRQLQSALKVQNHRLHKTGAKLQTINAVLTRFLQSGDIRNASLMLLESAVELSNSTSGLIGLLTDTVDSEPSIQLLALHGDAFKHLNSNTSYPISSFGEKFEPLFKTEHLFIENDLTRSTYTDSLIISKSINHILYLPVKKSDTLFGFIAVADRPGGYDIPEQIDIEQLVQSAAVLFECERRKQQAISSERQRIRAEAEVRYFQDEIKTQHDFEKIVGDSSTLRDILQQARQVAVTDATVLILGETGTGKELIARAIHNLSKRRNRPLITVNCAALPESLVESELFGHEKGAFTGATVQRKGRFELADGGTLFLDEIGDMLPETQGKLLRVLQGHRFERVGGTQTVSVDVRILAATHRNLKSLVDQGQFRSDLFYRLNIFPIKLPALRERRQDIEALACYFGKRFAAKLGRPFDGISSLALTRLNDYDWPGNVRELENVVQRAITLADGNTLEINFPITHETSDSAKPGDNGYSTAMATPMTKAKNDGSRTLDDVQRNHIISVLEDTRWLIEGPRGAAERLGLKPSTLRNRMLKLSIHKR